MAVLFVMYIPCEEEDEGIQPDFKDQVHQSKEVGGFEVVGIAAENDVGEDPRRLRNSEKGGGDSVAAKLVKSSASAPRILVFENEECDGGKMEKEGKVEKSEPKTEMKGSLLRSAQSTSEIYFAGDSDQQQSENKPLLSGKKAESTSKSVELLDTGLTKNLADSKAVSVNQSTGKFKVSKAPDGYGMDVLRPGLNGSRRISRDETKEYVHDVTTEVITLREAMFEVLDELGIENDVWEKNFDEDQWQIKFVVESKACDKVLNRLTAFGLGRIAGTSVSVFPASLHYSGKPDGEDEIEEKFKEKEEKKQKSEFVKSIKSRLTVAQVVGTVKSNAMLTFDFLVLILLASMIAALGLAESSSVVLVASMLISPLMGPIIGFTFGVVVKNPELWKLGVTNELIGLSICLTFGFLFGILTGSVNNTAARWGSSLSWPTAEMQARGMLRSLWVGVLIALPSGAGVALSILGGNTGSLVGVAISASLLPPAVNAGMLWGLALVSAISHPSLAEISNSTYFAGVPPDCRPLHDNDYKFYYSCDMQTEAAILASVSLLLTVLNILCIFLMGIVVLKIKEIAPHRAMSPATAAFWKRDLAFARSTYQTIKGRACLDMAKMAKEVINDYRAQNPDSLVEQVIGEFQHDPTLFEGPEELPEKTTRAFLRQLSHEGHEFVRRREKQTAEVVRLGDHVYHTIATSATARQLLQSSNSFRNTILECGDPEKSHRKGSVVRLRVKTETSPVSPLSPVPESEMTSDGELLMVDVGRFQPHQKVGRRERLSARHSLDAPTSPSPSRFRVKSIPEKSAVETPEPLPAYEDLNNISSV